MWIFHIFLGACDELRLVAGLEETTEGSRGARLPFAMLHSSARLLIRRDGDCQSVVSRGGTASLQLLGDYEVVAIDVAARSEQMVPLEKVEE
jgi:hypothetical protein